MKELNSHIEKCIRVLFTAVLIFCGAFTLSAAPAKHLAQDSSAVKLREPSGSSQQDYYNDDYYKYDRDKTQTKEEPGVFDRMLKDFLDGLLNSMQTEREGHFNPWSILWILLLISIVVLVVLRLTNSGVSGIFTGKRKSEEETSDATLEDVDIHGINYEEQIRSAVSRNDYRLAVRLWFLRTLKTFSDKELLSWKIDKTNSDYFYELSGTNYQQEFGDLSKVYDYIWYGEFPVDELSYRSAEEKFRGLNGKIQ